MRKWHFVSWICAPLEHWGLSGSAATGWSEFALSTNEVESNLCDEGTKEGTDLDGKSSWLACVYFRALIFWFSTGFSWVPTKGVCIHSCEFEANHIQKEACMLIKLTSFHIAWANLDLSCSNVGMMFLAQYPLVPTSMAKKLTIHPRFFMQLQRVA